MRKKIETLPDYIWMLGNFCREIGVTMTDEEFARRMDLDPTQFQSLLQLNKKLSQELVQRFWKVFDAEYKEVQRSNVRARFRIWVGRVISESEKINVTLTREEVLEKLGLSKDIFDAYWNGDQYPPEEVFQSFTTIWFDFFRNLRTVSHFVIEHVHIEEEEEDEGE